MTDDHKPLWPWIAALLIGLPVLYVASFGPACWLADRNARIRYPVRAFFRPAAALAVRIRIMDVESAILRYGEWGSRGGPTTARALIREELIFAHRPELRKIGVDGT